MMSHLRALGQGKLQQLLLHVAKPYLCQTVIPASEEFACSSFQDSLPGMTLFSLSLLLYYLEEHVTQLQLKKLY